LASLVVHYSTVKSQVAFKMSVQTNTFGALRLTGKDARKFENQLRYGRPKQAAQDAAARGKVMLAKFKRDGHVVVRVMKRA